MSNTPNPTLPSSKPNFVKKSFDLPRISELNKSHPARTYLSKRRIPEDRFKDLYYCENFRKSLFCGKYWKVLRRRDQNSIRVSQKTSPRQTAQEDRKVVPADHKK